MRRTLLFVVVALAAFMFTRAACTESPAEGYDAFLTAAFARDFDGAYRRFDDESRRRMEELHATGKTDGKEPAQYLFEQFRPEPATHIEVVNEDGDRAILAVTLLDGSEVLVPMVKEGGHWRIAAMEGG
jgi:hypothetical protein